MEDPKDSDPLTPSKLWLLKDNETALDRVDVPRPCNRLWRRTELLAGTF